MKIKKGFIYLIFFFIFLSNNSSANDKIAFIDLDLILNTSNLGKKISENLNKINLSNNDKIKGREKLLIEEENEIKKTQNVLSKEELNIKITKLKEKFRKYNIEKDIMQDEFNKKREKEILVFFEKINPLIQAYMDNNGIKLLIEKKNIFIGRSSDDITANILEIINDKFK